MGEYLFLTSLNGHQKDIPVIDALQTIRSDFAASYRILGSYSSAAIPEGATEPGGVNDH
jgi:prephenate dehydratase